MCNTGTGELEPWQGIICPQCFDELYEVVFGYSPTWELRPDKDTIPSSI